VRAAPRSVWGECIVPASLLFVSTVARARPVGRRRGHSRVRVRARA
jgi:hypothetical protein